MLPPFIFGRDNAAILARLDTLQAAILKELKTMSDTFSNELAGEQSAVVSLATAVVDNTAATKKLTDQIAQLIAASGGAPSQADLAAMAAANKTVADQAASLEAAAQAILNPPTPPAAA